MTTKERIIDESLTLFSEKGFSGVSVKKIAEAVGIKDSSLYKHFSSKKEIFDTILEEMTRRMDELTATLHIADATKGDVSPYFVDMTIEELVELSKKVFLFYIKDEFAARFRRMLTIEQYHDSEVSTLYKKIFTQDSIEYQTLLFSQLIQGGIFHEENPELMAMNFYAPIFLLITKYDNEPEKEEEALEILEKHVREFSRIYQK